MGLDKSTEIEINENVENTDNNMIEKEPEKVKINDSLYQSYRMNETNSASGLPPPILVKIKDPNMIEKIWKNDKRKVLKTDMLSLIEKIDDRSIYINPHLTMAKQYIYKKARDARRNKIVEYAWVRSGEVYVRKTKTSKIILIKHADQLNDM